MYSIATSQVTSSVLLRKPCPRRAILRRGQCSSSRVQSKLVLAVCFRTPTFICSSGASLSHLMQATSQNYGSVRCAAVERL